MIIDDARRNVCRFAADAEEAALFMRMLGIFPGDEQDDPVGMECYRRAPALPNTKRAIPVRYR